MRFVESAVVLPVVIFIIVLSFQYGLEEYAVLRKTTEEYKALREENVFLLPEEVLSSYSFVRSLEVYTPESSE